MSRLPLLVTAAVTAVAVTAVPATAARPKPKKPVCKLITDGTGDAHYPAAAAPSQDLLDVVYADIASDATRLTVVVKTKDRTTTDSLYGYSAAVRFTPPGAPKPVYLAARSDAVQGLAFEWGFYDTASQSYNRQGNAPDIITGWASGAEMHVTVKIAALAGLRLSPGSVLTGLVAETTAWSVPFLAQRSAAEITADTAASTKTYTAAWPSCVKVGS
jgi:hypothetical protein